MVLAELRVSPLRYASVEMTEFGRSDGRDDNSLPAQKPLWHANTKLL
jgi:hypothetical protein